MNAKEEKNVSSAGKAGYAGEENGGAEPEERMGRAAEFPDQALKESTRHGTVYRPFQAMNFPVPESIRFEVANHWHEETEILYLRKGSFVLERNMQKEELPEGAICIISSGELHHLVGLENGSSHSAILFHPQVLSFEQMDEAQSQIIRPLLSGRKHMPHFIRPEEECYGTVKALFEEMMELWTAKQYGWYFRCKVDLLQIVALLAEAGRLTAQEEEEQPGEERMVRIKQILGWIQDHFQEKIYLSDLAEVFDRNEQYLCRYFRETMGMTVTEYLNRYRVEQAAGLLEMTDKAVLDISLECGYDNFSYFIRRFRKYKGMTPTAYRKMVKSLKTGAD